ncbi:MULTISPECIES: his operon leader peptide [Klebsiella pneumoniae complex]|nr:MULTISPECIES: his operon leader peptide [Klebsiella]
MNRVQFKHHHHHPD